MRSRACPVRDAFSRGVPALAQTREPRKPRPILRWPNAPRPRELRPRELRPGEWPREEAPRSQPRPGDFGPADPRRVPVSRASEPPRENLGARPASPPPAEPIRLPRWRRGDERPRGPPADRRPGEDSGPAEPGRRAAERGTAAQRGGGAAEHRPAEQGPAHARAAEPGAAQPGTAQPGTAQPGTAQRRAAQRGAAGAGAAEQRAAEHALPTPAAEPDPGRARAVPLPVCGRRGPRPGPAQLEPGLTPCHRPGPRAAQAAPIAPGPLSRSDSRSSPASCRIAPWFAPGTGARAWLADQPARLPSPCAPARRSAAATAYSTNGHSSTS